jgi:hypothetical protein
VHVVEASKPGIRRASDDRNDHSHRAERQPRLQQRQLVSANLIWVVIVNVSSGGVADVSPRRRPHGSGD